MFESLFSKTAPTSAQQAGSSPAPVTSQPVPLKSMSPTAPTEEERQTARLRGGCIPCPVSRARH
ncbi:hypothetical protein CALCODRAFT_501986 [Calocera cornea HHB12733]|uniref:Uncharacterized protein n=1 Tax=Calocera cornea HHB12733 TaxID=1353952 RepID=A0A165DFR3_9BASI|nr:hypothetical protein CALCODRAFT_501986 [Calocera cornea HHB12733]